MRAVSLRPAILLLGALALVGAGLLLPAPRPSSGQIPSATPLPTLIPTPFPTVSPSPSPTPLLPVSCDAFPTQAAAQAAYRNNPATYVILDVPLDGVICIGRPCPCDFLPVSTQRPGEIIPTLPPISIFATPTPVPIVSTAQVQLNQGCNNVSLTWPVNTPLATVAAGVSGTTLIAIWRLETLQGFYVGYSPLPNAPNDYTAVVERLEAAFICVTGPGTLTRQAA